MYRKVKRYFEGRKTQDGAGVKLRRCFGYHQIPDFDSDSKDLKHYPQGVLYEDGKKIRIKTGQNPGRFLFLAGKKLEEPVAWGGLIVMNTRAELETASRELDNGTFIKNIKEKNINQINKFYQKD